MASSSTPSSQRQILRDELSKLLGFDDGAEDVLHHLLTIESGSDLLDYLSQLLGSTDDPIKQFVENVGKFQRGEELQGQPPQVDSVTTKDGRNNRASEQSTNVFDSQSNVKLQKLSAKKKTEPNSKQSKKQPPPPQPKKMQPKLAPPSVAKKETNVPVKDKGRPATRSEVDTQASDSLQNITLGGKKKVTPPARGKAKFDCGCFGTLHRPIANCLYCGRIACEREGYGYCPYCGVLIEKMKPPDLNDSNQKKAWLHKERLLQYDREFAQRTVVFDDQSDFFESGSQWLSADEKAKAKEKDEERMQQLLHRKNMQLELLL